MNRLFCAACALVLTLAACTSVSDPEPPAPPPPAVTGEPPAPAAPMPDVAADDDATLGSFVGGDALALDPGIRTGTFANGLTWYVDRNQEPQGRAEMRLVVDAGSALEDEDQRGFAHFLEHMLFNGTERFEKNEIISFLERSGMRFGVGLNAYTSFDETVYTLTIPTDSMDLYATAFDVLEDWATSATISEEEVDRERGVIMEEWRARQQSAQGRILEQIIPAIAYDSRYADRLPIGDTAVVQRGSAERMRDFYETYYRPDRMAVIVVGDVDVEQTVAMLEEHFAGLENPDAPAPPNTFEVPPHSQTLVRSVTDPEYPVSTVEIDFKVPAQPLETRADFERQIAEQLFAAMMNARLSEVAREQDAPFLAAQVYRSGFVRPVEIVGIQAQIESPEAVAEGLEGLLREVERVRRFGFTPGELDRARADVLRGYERAFNERETTSSGARAAQLVSLYLEDEAVPGAEAEYALAQEIVPALTAADVNALADELLREDNRLVLATLPDRPGQDEPTDAELRAVFEAAQAQIAAAELEPYDDAVEAGGLVPDGLTPAAVAERAELAAADAVELTLANGVRVRLKPTDFKTDEVVFTATSPGGLSRVSDADFFAGSIASRIAAESGAGELDRTDLEKVLAGKTIGVAPYIGETDEGFNGSFEPDEAETAMQLIYAYFADPRFDSAALSQFQAQLAGVIPNLDGVPNIAFQRAQAEALYPGNVRRRPVPTVEEVQALTTEQLERLYADRFADASDFVFTFTGAFDVERMTELAQLYLGNLPATPRDDAPVAANVPAPVEGVTTRDVYAGAAPQSTVSIQFYGPFDFAPSERLAHQAMVEVLGIQIREDLREERGGVYSPAVRGSRSDVPRDEQQVTVQFTCDPDRTDELAGAVLEQVERLRQNGPSEENMAKVKEQLRRTRETSLRTNPFWVSTLDFYALRPGEDLADVAAFDARVAGLTADDVQQAAQRYLDLDGYARFVLYPASYADQAE